MQINLRNVLPKYGRFLIKQPGCGLMAILCHHNPRNLFALCLYFWEDKMFVPSNIRTDASFINSTDTNISLADA